MVMLSDCAMRISELRKLFAAVAQIIALGLATWAGPSTLVGRVLGPLFPT